MSWKALDWATDSEVGSSTTKFILLLLANKADENFSCYPSIRTLMVESDAGRSTGMRALKELEASGFITREPQFHDSGARRPSRYYLNHPLAPHCSPRPNPGPPRRPDSTRAPTQRGTGPVSERHPTGVPDRDLLNSHPNHQPNPQPTPRACDVRCRNPGGSAGRMPETSYLPLRLLWRQAGRPRTSQPIFREAPPASETRCESWLDVSRIYPTHRQNPPHRGVVRRMRRRAIAHDHRNLARRNRSCRVLPAVQSAGTATGAQVKYLLK